MSNKLLTSGGSITFSPQGAWTWFGGFSGELQVAAEEYPLRINNSPVALAADIEKLASQLLGKMYVEGAYSSPPGTVTQATVTVDRSTLTNTAKIRGQAPATGGTKGQFTITVSPAIAPGVPPVPDPVVTKSGTWEVTSPGQELVSVD